jgi:hypothetical protein
MLIKRIYFQGMMKKFLVIAIFATLPLTFGETPARQQVKTNTAEQNIKLKESILKRIEEIKNLSKSTEYNHYEYAEYISLISNAAMKIFSQYPDACIEVIETIIYETMYEDSLLPQNSRTIFNNQQTNIPLLIDVFSGLLNRVLNTEIIDRRMKTHPELVDSKNQDAVYSTLIEEEKRENPQSLLNISKLQMFPMIEKTFQSTQSHIMRNVIDKSAHKIGNHNYKISFDGPVTSNSNFNLSLDKTHKLHIAVQMLFCMHIMHMHVQHSALGYLNRYAQKMEDEQKTANAKLVEARKNDDTSSSKPNTDAPRKK